MTLETASLVALCIGIYLAIGLVFALLFVCFGAGKIDPAARNMPVQARLTILPGCMLLWPLMLLKWLTQKAPPVS